MHRPFHGLSNRILHAASSAASQRAERCHGGFTLIEVLAGLVILALIMTTSLAVFYQREKRLRQAEETSIVWQALSNEVELRRLTPYSELATGTSGSFVSDSTILGGLDTPRSSVTVEQLSPGVKKLVLTVRWRDDTRSASLSMIRTDTGGENLW